MALTEASEAVLHYKRKLNRHVEDASPDIVLHCLEKLEQIPVNIRILQETGIGKVVNHLGKSETVDESVVEKAREIVLKWKEIVANEEKLAEEPGDDDSDPADSASGSDHEDDLAESEDHQKDHDELESGSDSSEDTHDSGPPFLVPEAEPPSRSSNKPVNKSSSHNSESRKLEDEKKVKKEEIVAKSSSKDKERSSRDKESGSGKHSSTSSHSRSESSSSNKSKKKKKDKHKEKEKDKGKKSRDESTERRKRKHSDEEEGGKSKKRKHEHSDEDKDSKKKQTTSTKSDKKKRHEDEEREKSHKKKQEVDKKVEVADRKRNDSDRKKDSDRKHHHDSERKKVNEDEKSKSKSSKKSFADTNGFEAAMMAGDTGSGSKKDSKKKTESETKKSSRIEREDNVQPQMLKPQSPAVSYMSDVIAAPPAPSRSKPMTHSLPERSFANITDGKTDDEALSALIAMAKSQKRTAVYSGNKRSAFGAGGHLPTLIELCVHKLQENVDKLIDCRKIPFEILEPILERAKPETLLTIEDYNPYLMEATGHLWERICKKQFPKEVRQEFEAWREMYERCTTARKAKLDFLTTKVQQSYKNVKAESRKTKLAYVDVGASRQPRHIPQFLMMSSAKNGTAATPTPTQPVRKVGAPVPSKPPKEGSSGGGGGGGGSMAGAAPAAAKKPKVAPMMAKTLKMVRGLKVNFRR